MTVRLKAPWAGQAIGTLYTGGDEDYLLGVGKADGETGRGHLFVLNNASYTLRAGDAHRAIVTTSASPVTIRVASYSFEQAPFGVLATIRKEGAGNVTVQADDGGTIASLTTLGQTVVVRRISGTQAAADGVVAVTIPPFADYVGPGGGVIPPAPVLGSLSLSASLMIGTAVSGSIIGASAGSTITGNIPGITINSGARTFTGTPTGSAATIANGLVETLAGATNSPRSNAVTVTAAGAALAITGTPSAATVGSPYSFTPNATGGSGTKTYALTGSLSGTGLAFSTSTGAITGTPTTAGTTTGLNITVTDTSGSASLGTFSLVVSAGAVGGLTPTAAPSGVTFSGQWHPHTATNLKDGGGTAAVGDPVVSSAERNALAAMSNPDTTLAPLLAQDASGRKYLNYQSSRYSFIDGTASTGLNGLDSQNLAVYFVGRIHKLRTVPIFYPRYQSDGVTANAANLGAFRIAPPTGSSASFPATGGNTTNAGATSTTGDRADMLVGTNMCVLSMVSRTSGASGGSGVNFGYNSKTAVTGSAVSARTGMIGAVIGATPASGGGVTLSQARTLATVLGMDLYEMIVVKGNVTDAQDAAIRAAIRANYSDIATYTDQFVDFGDSIKDGIVVRAVTSTTPSPDRVSGVESDQNIAAVLTAPGAMLVPATTKVVNVAISGGTTGTVATIRDGGGTAPNISPLDFRIGTNPTNNVVGVMLGRNDFSAGTTALQHYENVKALAYTGDGRGFLERGWNVVAQEPIAGTPSYMTDFLNEYRARLNGTTGSGYVAEVSALGSGYAGRVRLSQPSRITVGGVAIFGDGTASTNLTYYQQSSTSANSDATHPNPLGTRRLVDGGDTPQFGLKASFQ